MAERIRFLLDQHIPAAVAQGLRRRGADVLTAYEANRCGLPDAEQLRLAGSEGRVIVPLTMILRRWQRVRRMQVSPFVRLANTPSAS